MGPRAHELRRRVAVAVVGIPLVLASLYMGGWWFGVLLAAVAMIATAELFGLVAARGGRPYGVIGMAASGAIVLLATAEPTPGKTFLPGVTFYETRLPSGERERRMLDAGANPPDGVVVHYLLDEATKEDVTLTFLDSEGETIRAFSGKALDNLGTIDAHE